MSKRPVSATIITLNEEQQIERCLRSLTWADEIVVIDAFSEDRTPEICQDSNAPWADRIRFFQRPWSGFKDQRMYSLSKASHDWILVVDSDEECTPELRDRILQITAQDSPDQKYFKVRRIEFFLGKQINYGIWNPSYQDRFFHKKDVKYVNDIHEYPIFPTPPSKIHEPLIHAPQFSPEHFLAKMNKYTTIEARDRVEAGQRTNWFHLLFAAPAMFWKNYFYYGAYRDGFHGFVISILEGISRAVRHIKMWQIQSRLDERANG